MPPKRDRASAQGLLPLMEARPWKDGKTVTYRYHPIGGKPINLGTDREAAIRQVLDMTGAAPGMGTLLWVWQRFTDEKRPSPRWSRLAEGTRADYALAWKQVAKTFGRMKAAAITAPMVARYVNVERADTPRRAAIEKALLSNLFRYGITLGVCSSNPAQGIETPHSEARTEAPAPELLQRFLAWLAQQTPQRRIIGLMAEYASLAGSRRVEFLQLSWPQVDMDDGRPRIGGDVRTLRAKQRGKKVQQVVEKVEITPRLADLLSRVRELDRDCLYLFPTRDGNAYTDRGFKTLWQRCVLDAIKAKVIGADDRFTFHDLRAFYATQHKAERGALPDLHANPATTARVYDRSKEVKRRAL